MWEGQRIKPSQKGNKAQIRQIKYKHGEGKVECHNKGVNI